MQEYLRALIFIVFLAMIGFFFAQKIVEHDIPRNNFNKWRNVWLAIITTAFLAHNYWIYLFIGGILILLLTKSEQNKLALFFILLWVIPPIGEQIPGFGLVNYFFLLNHPRFIALVVLLPASFAIAQKNKFKFTELWTDKLLLLFAILLAALQLRDRTFTDALRNLFYAFTDIFLPYYVASRGIKELSQMNVALNAFLTSAFVIALIAMFEYARHWLLYYTLEDSIGTPNVMGDYLGRSGNIRAIASLIHPIVLGYFLTVALGFYLYLSTRFSNTLIKRIGFLLLIGGMLATLSRGPWVGATVLVLVFIILGPKPIKKLSTLFLVGLLALPIVMTTPAGGKIVDLLPFVGKTEKYNVEYRQKLFTNAVIVINRYPFFGSTNFRDTPEMKQMIQGEKIIDIVNSYLGITLESGYVGLFFFVSIFLCVTVSILRRMKKIKDKTDSLHILGASLVGTIIAIMITIATTSLIGTTKTIMWSVLGLGIAYTRIADDYLKSKASNNMA